MDGDLPESAVSARRMAAADAVCFWRASKDGLSAQVFGQSPADFVPGFFLPRTGVAEGIHLVTGAEARRHLPVSARKRFSETSQPLTVLDGRMAGGAGVLMVWTQPEGMPANATAIGGFLADLWARQAARVGANTEAARLRAQLHSLVYALPQGVVLVPKGYSRGLVNQTAATWLGLEPGEVLADALSEALAAFVGRMDDPDAIHAEVAATLNRNATRLGRRVWHLSGETSQDFRVTIAPFGETEPEGWVWLIEDVSEQEEATRTLARARRHAEEAARAKSSFLANMSHEIRTPMNGVIGMLDLLKTTRLSREQAHYVSVAQGSAEMQLQVINDILEFSKIEAGKLSIESIPFCLADVVEETAMVMAAAALSKGLELFVFIDPALPPMMVGDPTRLRQILANLLGNAVKFTQTGHVCVRAMGTCDDGTDQTPDRMRVRLEVEDTGIGMSPQGLAGLFKEFSQADTSTTRKFGGTGLGLTISKQLTERMGGTITVTSEVERGSTFAVTVPLGRTDAAAPTHDAQALGDMSILVVDDVATNREILARYLTAWGVQNQAVAHPFEALDRLRRETFDLVLLDYQMPDMDGIALARTIQTTADIQPKPRLLLLSSSAVDEVATLGQSGIEAMLMKPLRQSALLAALSGRGVDQTTSDAVDVGRLPQFQGQVLVADDVFVNQQVASGLLQKLGLGCAMVGNGQEAVDAVANASFDLVLMDIQMPEMDGLEATRLIRQREQAEGLARVPIVAMTAQVMAEDVEATAQAGMDAYVSKPIEIDRLVEVLGRWLEQAPQADPPEKAPASAPPAADDPASDTVCEGLDPKALEALRSAMAGMPGGVVLILSDFLTSGPRLLSQARDALAAGDVKTFTRAVHSLKTSAATIGAMDLSRQAAALEALGRADRMAEAGPGLTEAEATCAQVCPRVQALIDQENAGA